MEYNNSFEDIYIDDDTVMDVNANLNQLGLGEPVW